MPEPFSDFGLFVLYALYLRSNVEWQRWYAAGMAAVLPPVQIARFAAQLAQEAACGCELSVQFCEFIEAATAPGQQTPRTAELTEWRLTAEGCRPPFTRGSRH
jgi:hypothetical protein